MQVRWGDALRLLPALQLPEGCDGIDLLLLDGVPKETLAYLRAAEPLLSDGAVVVADNAGALSTHSRETALRFCHALQRPCPCRASAHRPTTFRAPPCALLPHLIRACSTAVTRPISASTRSECCRQPFIAARYCACQSN